MDEPIIDLQSDHYFMGEALRQAAKAYEAEKCRLEQWSCARAAS